MASGGTTAVQQYDFYDGTYRKYMECAVDTIKYGFYVIMFLLLVDPNTNTLKTGFGLKGHTKNARASSVCVMVLVGLILVIKFYESYSLIVFGYKEWRRSLFNTVKKSRRTQVAERLEESANDRNFVNFGSNTENENPL